MFFTFNMDTDVIHLWMRAWAFIWYRGICNWCTELFVKLSVKDVGFRVCVISQDQSDQNFPCLLF